MANELKSEKIISFADAKKAFENIIGALKKNYEDGMFSKGIETESFMHSVSTLQQFFSAMRENCTNPDISLEEAKAMREHIAFFERATKNVIDTLALSKPGQYKDKEGDVHDAIRANLYAGRNKGLLHELTRHIPVLQFNKTVEKKSSRASKVEKAQEQFEELTSNIRTLLKHLADLKLMLAPLEKAKKEERIQPVLDEIVKVVHEEIRHGRDPIYSAELLNQLQKMFAGPYFEDFILTAIEKMLTTQEDLKIAYEMAAKAQHAEAEKQVAQQALEEASALLPTAEQAVAEATEKLQKLEKNIPTAPEKIAVLKEGLGKIVLEERAAEKEIQIAFEKMEEAVHKKEAIYAAMQAAIKEPSQAELEEVKTTALKTYQAYEALQTAQHKRSETKEEIHKKLAQNKRLVKHGDAKKLVATLALQNAQRTLERRQEAKQAAQKAYETASITAEVASSAEEALCKKLGVQINPPKPHDTEAEKTLAASTDILRACHAAIATLRSVPIKGRAADFRCQHIEALQADVHTQQLEKGLSPEKSALIQKMRAAIDKLIAQEKEAGIPKPCSAVRSLQEELTSFQQDLEKQMEEQAEESKHAEDAIPSSKENILLLREIMLAEKACLDFEEKPSFSPIEKLLQETRASNSEEEALQICLKFVREKAAQQECLFPANTLLEATQTCIAEIDALQQRLAELEKTYLSAITPACKLGYAQKSDTFAHEVLRPLQEMQHVLRTLEAHIAEYSNGNRREGLTHIAQAITSMKEAALQACLDKGVDLMSADVRNAYVAQAAKEAPKLRSISAAAHANPLLGGQKRWLSNQLDAIQPKIDSMRSTLYNAENMVIKVDQKGRRRAGVNPEKFAELLTLLAEQEKLTDQLVALEKSNAPQRRSSEEKNVSFSQVKNVCFFSKSEQGLENAPVAEKPVVFEKSAAHASR